MVQVFKKVMLVGYLKKIRLIFLILLALLVTKHLYENNQFSQKIKIEEKFVKKEILDKKVDIFLENMQNGINKVSFSFQKALLNNKEGDNEKNIIYYEDNWFIKAFNSSLMIALVLILMYKTTLNLLKG